MPLYFDQRWCHHRESLIKVSNYRLWISRLCNATASSGSVPCQAVRDSWAVYTGYRIAEAISVSRALIV